MKISDRKGIEGFPLQLLITFIVIAIVVPFTWNYFSIYSEQQTRDVIQNQFQYFEAAVRDVYSMGPGNTRVVEMNIDGGMMAQIDYVKFGSTPGDAWSNLSSCRYRISGHSEQLLMITNPNIPMVNLSGGLEIGSGNWMISITSMDEWQLQMDVDGDGMYFSRFVEVGII